MSLIPESWLPNIKMKRIVCHWTAGAYNPSANDLSHYHLLVDGDSELHRGTHSIAQNHHDARGGYAAHTYGLNTDSIGVSICCMGGAQGKQSLGRYPLKKEQWETLAHAVAELCTKYKLEPTEREVLMHGDVHRVYGIDQWGKWDINFLPWAPKMGHDDVGHEFRRLVKEYMASPPTEGIEVFVDRKKVGNGINLNGSVHVPARAVAEALGAAVDWDPDTQRVDITSP